MHNAVQLCLTANNILHMRKGNRAFQGRSLRFLRIFIIKTNLVIKLMIKQLLNLVIAKYHDLSLSCRSIIFDLLATDKSQYFSHPRPVIVNF